MPNKIIQYSCYQNHYILPLYLYSAINRKYYNNIVDTNIYHITRTFDLTADKRYSKESNFLKTLLLLNDDISTTVEDKNGNKKLFEFSACWSVINFNTTLNNLKIDYSDRIQYEFQDTSDIIQNNFTIIYYDEYEYIINYLTKMNQEIMVTKEVTGKGKQKNMIDILDFYVYLKYIISLSNNYNHEAHPTIKTLAEKMSIGKTTVTEYTNILVNMGMIEYLKGDFSRKSSNVYNLSNKWRNNNG